MEAKPKEKVSVESNGIGGPNSSRIESLPQLEDRKQPEVSNGNIQKF